MENLSAPPYLREGKTVSQIMRNVIISLLPIWAMAIYRYQVHAFLHLVSAVLACVATEYLFERVTKRKVTISDCSAVVTGLLIALGLPAYAPVWLGAVGGVFAILIVKQACGGIGRNFLNPAAAARCFLLLFFPAAMKLLDRGGDYAATSAKLMETGGKKELFQLLAGDVSGCIGELSAIAVLIGAILLVLLDVIKLYIPVSYIISFSLLVLAFGGRGFDMTWLSAQLAGGGLMLTVWFMATDYSTSPATRTGQIFYGLLLGILTGIMHVLGYTGEERLFALLVGNVCARFLDFIIVPKAFFQGMR